MNTPISFFHVAVTSDDPSKFEQFYSRHFGMKRARSVALGEGNIIELTQGFKYQ